MEALKPYGAAASASISDMTVETDEDVLTITGSLEARRDRRGLELLRRLSRTVSDAIRTLESQELPDVLEDRRAGPSIENPFS